MTNPYILFHQSAEQLRQIGARGGRAYARNRRARLRAPVPLPRKTVVPAERHTETAAEAIATLDAQFPWLRGAEQRSAQTNRERSIR